MKYAENTYIQLKCRVQEKTNLIWVLSKSIFHNLYCQNMQRFVEALLNVLRRLDFRCNRLERRLKSFMRDTALKSHKSVG